MVVLLQLAILQEPGQSCSSTGTCLLNYANSTSLRTGKTFGTFAFTGCAAMTGSRVTDYEIEYLAVGDSLTHTVQGKANLKVE